MLQEEQQQLLKLGNFFKDLCSNSPRSMALDTSQGYVYFGLGSGELLRIRRNETRDMTTFSNLCTC